MNDHADVDRERWASLARIRFDPRSIDGAIELVKAHLVTDFVARPGARSGYWMVDRMSGHAVVVLCWASREALEDSRAALGAARAMVIEELDALLTETGVYAVHGCAGDGDPISGQRAWSRILFVEGLAPGVDDPDHVLFRTARRRYENRAGFLSLCWLVDAPSGNGLGIVTWDTEAACRAGEPASRRTRRHVDQAYGCHIHGEAVVETIAAAAPVRDQATLTPHRRMASQLR